MNLTPKTAALTACLALAGVPAMANAAKPENPGSQGHEKAAQHRSATVNGNGHSQRCKKPTVLKGYVASGMYGPAGSFTATKNADGTYSGSVSFTVTKANHHAKGATGPFSFTSAKVTFDSPTATAPALTDNVRMIGKITVAKSKCTGASAVQVTIRKLVFSAPRSAQG
jgi:hypothetical protein